MKKSPIRIIIPPGPLSWSSLCDVLPNQLDFLKKNLDAAIDKDFFITPKKTLKKDDLWILPIGSTQWPVFEHLKRNFANPSNRPPIIFFLNGEGAKLGYHICRYRDVFQRYDKFVVSSFAEKKILDWITNDPNRTLTMFLPIDKSFSLAKKNPANLAKKYKFNSRKKLILYAGRLSAQKNILSLLDFAKNQDEDSHLIICGRFDSLQVPHFKNSQLPSLGSLVSEALLQDSSLSHRISFLSHLPQSDLRNLMAKADAQISLSSHYGEDFGYSICQGLHMGLPTVITKWGGHNNWVHFSESTSIRYIDLNWQKEKIGKPPKFKLYLSKLDSQLRSQNSSHFFNSYQHIINSQLEDIIESTEHQSQLDCLNPEVLSWWSNKIKRKDSYLFESHLDPMFRQVVKYYSSFPASSS